jgi:hypothetical protein
MRRMRDMNWRHLFVALGVVSLTVGAYYGVKKYYPLTIHSKVMVESKTTAAKPARHKDRKIAQVNAEQPNVKQSSVEPPKSGAPELCASLEYPGDGPERTKITKEQWARTMEKFHRAKKDLLAWLTKNKNKISDNTAGLMETQIRDLKIQRPVAMEEPDIAWRGIGAWTLDEYGLPLIRVGSGLVKLVEKEPARARFEITRLVAQAWAPCELVRIKAKTPWDPVLDCLGARDKEACALGGYSEEGWALSSALAVAVASPGCALPALENVNLSACIKQTGSGVTASAFQEHKHTEHLVLNQEGRP